MFSGTMVLFAQDYCIVYRAAVVLFGGRHLPKSVAPRAKSFALLTIFGVALLNAFVWYFHTTADKVVASQLQCLLYAPIQVPAGKAAGT